MIAADAVEDSYGLSPLQQGMLIHSLRDTGVGMYVNQAVHRLEDVDVDALTAAWEHVVQRHTILRSSFHWEDVEEPEQRVHAAVRLPITRLDWREQSAAEQESALQRLLRDDRARGFELGRPPLLRLCLIRRGERSHYLIFSHHHLLLDGWSHPLILAEVRAAYDSLRAGRPPALPAPRPYKQFIEWLARQDAGRDERFWRRYLHGVLAPTPLPFDLGAQRRRSPRPEFGAWRTRLSAELLTDLERTARTARVTVNTLVHGAWSLALARHAGERDVVFGVLVSGRPPELEGVETMIGMFVNTLPVRVRVDSEKPLTEWLRELQRDQTELQRHEATALLRVQRWSEVPPGTPLFESVLVNEKTTRDAPARPGPRAHREGGTAERALPPTVRQNVPLLLGVDVVAGELVLTLTADGRRFVDGAMPRLMEQLRTALEAMPEHGARPIGELPLASAAETALMLGDWNRTSVQYPRERCLHELFEAQVDRTPDAPAVGCQGEQLSYAELERRSNGLAAHLRDRGVGRGAVVGLCVERSLPMVVGLLAILKAGAAYVPLDPHYPAPRLRFMLDDARAVLLVTQEPLLDRLGATNTPAVCLDRDRAAWEHTRAGRPSRACGPEDLVYLLYTSGSTGVPKGVAVPHRVAVNRLHVEVDPFTEGEVLPVKTSLSFVDSVWEMFSAWQNGLRAELIPEARVRDPRLLVAALREAGATRMVLVPSLLRALLDADLDLAAELPRLVHWISSGEPLPADLCARFAEQLPGAVLTNLYGISEIWDATRSDSRAHGRGAPLPIGRPLGNVRVCVLDAALRPVPIGVAGELHVAGDGLAHGYFRRPGLTAERFVPDPFAEVPGGRLYRTGDRARWLPHGELDYLGRQDRQLKLAGFRIEPGEVEDALRRHEAVAQAAVVAGPEGRLIAYVVGSHGPPPDTRALQAFARRTLPEHMVPTACVALDALPLTPSGKVDRRALRPPGEGDLEALVADVPFRAAATETERVVAETWAEVLGIGRVGADSDFFSLGGHSLLAMRVVSRLSRALGIEVPLGHLFEERTVAALAARVDRMRRGEDDDAGPDLAAAPRGRLVPASYAQQRLWVLDQLNPGSAAYTVPSLIRFDGRLDLDGLRAALRAVVRRHEALRTTFAPVDGRPMQVIHEDLDVPLELHDLRATPASERERAVSLQRREQARRPWDLARGPLVRALLLRLADDRHALSVTMHHIVTDGRSMGIFAHELAVGYRSLADGREPRLPDLPVQYADFAIWQRERLAGERLQREREWWRRQLDGAARLELPAERPRSAQARYRAGRRRFVLEAEQVRRLQAISRREGTTGFMALLAGFAVLLGRYCGERDVSIATPVANRDRVELEQLIGLFVNTLVLRCDVGGNPSFRALLRRVERICREAYAHAHVPFDEVVSAVGPERDPTRQPLFDAMLVYQHAGAGPVSPPGIAREPESPEAETANFDVLLLVTERANGIDCMLQYNADLLSEMTATRMAGNLELLLRRALADPERSLAELTAVQESELRELYAWSGAGRQPPEPRCVHALVAEAAARAPDAVAARLGAESLSYGELLRRSHDIAARLQAAGVGRGSVVALCLERSFELLAALQGTLEAGAAFLVLDPALPRRRLAWALDDAGAAAAVTAPRTRAVLPPTPGTTVVLDPQRPHLREHAPATRAAPEDLAYVTYTSGSTGTPKGVLVEHRSLAAVIQAQVQEFEIGPGSRVLPTLSLGFDAALGEIFRALVAGATLHLAARSDLLPGPGLVSLLREQGITHLATTPTALAEIPGEGRALPELRTIVVGGEPCPPDVVARWAPGRRLLNGYGPSETTIGATVASGWDPARTPPLGRPLPGARVHVLDERMRPLPVGAPGMLYIGGAGVARGYLHAPAATADRFVPDPFGARGSRLYATGDRARWDTAGMLHYLGRSDQQLKVRGHRVEPGEIEAVLRTHPAVSACAVQPWERDGTRRLAAYVTPAADGEPAPERLRAFLRERLPEHMVPAWIVVLPALPLTASGKLDRGALPPPDAAQVETQTPYEPPRTPVERTLAGIWGGVLGLERVGIRSNFFELGGDSIATIRLAARAGEAGLALTPRDVFEHQTIAELAGVVGAAAAEPREREPISGSVPLTPIQRWFLDRDPPAPDHFNQWTVVEAATLEWEPLVEALRVVMEHHDALRARFERRAGSWRQWIEPPGGEVPAVRVDLSGVAPPEQERRIEEVVADLQTSLDLGAGPLLRLVAFERGAAHRPRLALIVHHLVIDSYSWTPLLDDLRTAYRQLRDDRPPALPPRSTSFMRWAEELVRFAGSDAVRGAAPYWLDQAATLPEPLPRDDPDGPNDRGSTAFVTATLDEHDTRALLEELPRAHGCEVPDVLIAGLALALCGWSGQERARICVEGHGREDIGAGLDLSRTVGWFTSFRPVVVAAGVADGGLGAAIEQIRDGRAALPEGDISYSLLRYLTPDDDIRRQIATLPEPEVAFNYSGRERGERTAVGRASARAARVQLSEAAAGPRRQLLAVNAGVRGGRLTLRLSYSRNVHRRQTIQRLAESCLDHVRTGTRALG